MGNVRLELEGEFPISPNRGKVYWFNIKAKVDHSILGYCYLLLAEPIDSFLGNVGYFINEEQRGNHYAEEACKEIICFIKEKNMKIDSIRICCSAQNTASIHICQKLGGKMIGKVCADKGDSVIEKEDERIAFEIKIKKL